MAIRVKGIDKEIVPESIEDIGRVEILVSKYKTAITKRMV